GSGAGAPAGAEPRQAPGRHRIARRPRASQERQGRRRAAGRFEALTGDGAIRARPERALAWSSRSPHFHRWNGSCGRFGMKRRKAIIAVVASAFATLAYATLLSLASAQAPGSPRELHGN